MFHRFFLPRVARASVLPAVLSVTGSRFRASGHFGFAVRVSAVPSMTMTMTPSSMSTATVTVARALALYRATSAMKAAQELKVTFKAYYKTTQNSLLGNASIHSVER